MSLPADALHMVAATLAVALMPGVLVTLLWWPRTEISLLELAGFGVAISALVVQLFTVVAVVCHIGPDAILWLGAALCVAAGLRVAFRPSCRVTVDGDDLLIGVLLILMAIPLYLQGSPVQVYEDQVLVAIMRRLSELPHPAFGNIYVTPGVPYTYPFPGTLYLMALITRLADVDALFVYHKLRFFWGPAAVVLLSLAARSVFGHRAVATSVAVTAVVLICSGSFAAVAEFPAWWAQLVPYSYGPDVAMTVLLPALLVSAFAYLLAGTRRERAFFFTVTSGLVFVLTAVHVREVVQFAVYMASFAMASAIFRRLRPYLGPSVTLTVATIFITGTYTAWQSWMVPVLSDVVGAERAQLVNRAAALPMTALLFAPAPAVLGDFIQDFDQMFAGLVPFLLVAGPAVIVFFRHQPLIWLVATSVLSYLAIMSIPALAVPYLYATYFEMLQIPVRNIIFFLYLFAGAIPFIVVTLVSGRRFSAGRSAMSGTAVGLAALLMMWCLNGSHWAVFLPLLAAYGFVFIFASERRVSYSVLAGVAAAVVAVALLFPREPAPPRSEQVTIRWAPSVAPALRQQLERQLSLAAGSLKTDAPDRLTWNYRLADLSRGNVESIVTHAAVADTHFIDRSTFTVESQPPPGDHLPLGVRYVSWLQYPATGWVVATAVLFGFISLAVPPLIARLPALPAVPFARTAILFVLFVVPFAALPARPTLSPLALTPMPPAGRADTPADMLARIECLPTPELPARFAEDTLVLPARTVCPPDPRVVAWIRANVDVDAVFAIDRWTSFPLQMFVPQRAVVFPTLDATFLHEDELFRDYYVQFSDRIARYGVQPFFNSVETPEDRRGFVHALQVTHVLVNPDYYGALRPILDTLPQDFTLQYDQDRWAVYSVVRRAGAAS